jgi:hypothetical protein
MEMKGRNYGEKPSWYLSSAIPVALDLENQENFCLRSNQANLVISK